MKDKNRKILKGLGVGALACVGMIGLTGCANIEVSQDKVDSIIETVEKVDNRLDEYVDLLEKTNRMTKEEVWNFAQTADFNLMMNVNGLRDNLIVTGVVEDLGLQQDICLYYNTDSVSVFAGLDGEGSGIMSVELWYQTIESNVILADIDKAGDDYICKRVNDRGEDDIFENSIGVYRGGLFGINANGLTYEDLNHYEILDNGNIKMVFVKYEYNYQDESDTEYEKLMYIYTFEYSAEGRLTSEIDEVKYLEESSFYENENTENFTIKYKLSYGAVDTELVESWVELAEEYRNEQ